MIKKIWIDSREQHVHLVGEYVGVAWNFDFINTRLKDGRTITDRVRQGVPYISAWHIYEIDEFGIAEVSSDSPLDHGVDLDFAKQIHKELGEAIEYLNGLEDVAAKVKNETLL